jgi:hypothetical protein
MPAAKARTVQRMRSGGGDEMEIPRSATRLAGSEQQDRRLGGQFC